METTREPDFLFTAPGRVNLIGEHIDYLGGAVLPAALDRGIHGKVWRRKDRSVRVASSEIGEQVFELSLDDLQRKEGSWLNYLAGVIAVYAEAGITSSGFDLQLDSDLPSGAGLSSSAALEAVVALAVEALSGTSLPPEQRAALCRKAEHEWAGVPCGIMDQLAVCDGREGHALLINCASLERRPVKLPDGLVILVADTQVKHSLDDGGYETRRRQAEEAAATLGVDLLCEASVQSVEEAKAELGDIGYRRARHAVTELARVHSFIEALESNDATSCREILSAGHASLRDDYEVSCAELDLLVEAAEEFGRSSDGFWGARMTGGGFGGSTVHLVEADQAEALARHLQKRFTEHFDHEPAIFPARPSAGAHVL